MLVVILMWGLSLLVMFLVIRGAIDSSKTSRKLDELIVEIVELKKEIKENKHIIDKRM